MKKLLFTALIIASTTAFANPVVPTESFKPNTTVENKVTIPIQQNTTNVQGATNIVNVPVLTKQETPVENKSEPAPVKNLKEDKAFVEVQNYSTQTTEEYLKRRNSTFNGSLSACINQIPKNAKGQRDPEAMLKCANSK